MAGSFMTDFDDLNLNRHLLVSSKPPPTLYEFNVTVSLPRTVFLFNWT